MAKNINFLGNVTERNQELVSQYPAVNSTISYVKDVPDGALPYADVTIVGGMSYKTKNLLKPYTGSSNWNGYLITRNKDGSVSITGAAAETKEMLIDIVDVINHPVYMNAGEKYTLTVTKDGVPVDIGERIEYKDEAGGNYWGWPGDTSRARALSKLYVQKTVSAGDNTTLNGVYRAILTKGNTVVPYEPYFDGLRDSKVTEIKSVVGVNLFDYESHKKNGNTSVIKVIPSKTLYRNAQLSYSSAWEIYDNADALIGTFESFNFTASNPLVLPSNAEYIKSRDGADSLADFYLGYDSDITYRPYQEYSLPIPTAVQALDGYGEGVNESVYNYINWEKKQFVKRVGKLVLDGRGTTWTVYGDKTLYNRTLMNDAKKVGNNMVYALCNAIPYKDNLAYLDSTYVVRVNNDVGLQFNNVLTNFNLGECSSDAFNAYLSQNPMIFYYELAEPEVTDISDLLTTSNMIDVQPNGSVVFVNEYGYDIPSTLTCYNSAQYTIAGKLLGVAEKAIYDDDGEKLSKTRERVGATERGINDINKKIDNLQWACEGSVFDEVTCITHGFDSPTMGQSEETIGKYTTFSKIGCIETHVYEDFYHNPINLDMPVKCSDIGFSGGIDSFDLVIPDKTKEEYTKYLFLPVKDFLTGQYILSCNYIDLVEGYAVERTGMLAITDEIIAQSSIIDNNGDGDFSMYIPYSLFGIRGLYEILNGSIYGANLGIGDYSVAGLDYGQFSIEVEYYDESIIIRGYVIETQDGESKEDAFKRILRSCNAMLYWRWDSGEASNKIKYTPVVVDFDITVENSPHAYDCYCECGLVELSYLKKKEV